MADPRHVEAAVGALLGTLLGVAIFEAVLPALRRTFGAFLPPERRAIGEKAARLDGTGRPAPAASGTGAEEDVDQDRAALAVNAVAAILGLSVIDRVGAP